MVAALAFVSFVGYFQSSEAQFGCISCDSLGDFFQELLGQTSCQACPTNSRRYVGVLGALNRSSCQCKEGATSALAFGS